jgi:hypothetical protein
VIGAGSAHAQTPTPSPSATPITYSVNLAWNDNDADISGYAVLYGTVSKIYTETLPVVGNVTTATVSGLAPGTWFFAVTATNNFGLTSPPSIEISTTLTGQPSSPTNLQQSTGSHLASISTRGEVGVADNVLIVGFIITGNVAKNVIIRALGPSLTAFGVSGALADPTLELYDQNGTQIAFDDNWQDDPKQAAQIQAAGLAPTNANESALAENLVPAGYTAIVRGINNTTGVGLVEVYDLDGAGG